MTYPMPPELLEQLGLERWAESDPQWPEDRDALGCCAEAGAGPPSGYRRRAVGANLSTVIAEALYAVPVSPADAKRKPDDGGLSEGPGFYAWWLVPGSLPAVPSQPHPRDGTRLDLLYVGIAPNTPTSRQTVRSRVLNNHLGGNTGSSTFRYSLAALLMDAQDFQPIRRGAKYVLTQDHNRRLSEWQQTHLSLTWCEYAEPWTVEGAVIATMEPPMNLAENASHPFHPTMSAARRRFREAARDLA